MENLACIIVVFTAYCFWACAQYHDRPFRCTPDPIAPVDHFPTVDEVKEAIATPQPETKTITEPLPQAAAFKAIANTVKLAPIAVETDLTNLSIRELKKLASKAKIKRYSMLTRAELIKALS